jgi:hypothetical protein
LHEAVTRTELRRYSYVVLEELIQGSALLMAWQWPDADAIGLPIWPDATARPRESVIDRDLLAAQLYRPSRLRRSPRVGDVFAVAKTGPGWRTDRVDDVTALVSGRVFDITIDARAAAKLAYFGAVTGAGRPAGVRQRDRGLRRADDVDQPATRLRTDAPLRELRVLARPAAGEASR